MSTTEDAVIVLRYGKLIDTIASGQSSCDWDFVPARVELEGEDKGLTSSHEFRDDLASQGISYPNHADAAFVRARLPRVFGYTPEYDEGNEKCLLWDGFVGIDKVTKTAIPFVLSDYYWESRLFFGYPGPPDSLKDSIASDFWRLIALDPQDVEDFEQRVFHYGASVYVFLGCENGMPYYFEEE